MDCGWVIGDKGDGEMTSKFASSASYLSADTLPVKMLTHPDTKAAMLTDKLIPTHIQLVLTNKCNLLCPFCSYGAVDRKLELSKSELRSVLCDFANLGSDAVTITGGGEPTLHPQFNAIINEALDLYYKVGMITNGTNWNGIDLSGIDQMVWCRVSCSDYWDHEKYLDKLGKVVEKAPKTDWGMSYVVLNNGEFKPDNFAQCIKFAYEYGFKYVRVVSDLTHPDKATHMDEVKLVLVRAGVDDSIVIYQGRKNTTPGFKQCWISLIKPYIGADGEIYPCCGVQYAEDVVSFNTPKSMRMGNISDIRSIWAKQVPFDGSKCVRCHYHQYNTVWGMLKQGIHHAEFI